jgi:hypothetical protein
MTSQSIVVDVCVIGGGPAGSTAAQRLATLGYRVCVIERDLLWQRSYRGVAAANHPAAVGGHRGARTGGASRFRAAPTNDCVVVRPDPHDQEPTRTARFHVDRGRFDLLLLENAQARGVRIFQPAEAMRPERLNGGGWKTRLCHCGQPKEVTSRFVVDASGGGIIPGRRARVSAPLLALYAHWTALPSGGFVARVEAGENEWFWYAPLGSGKSVAAVFIDPKRLRGTTSKDIDAAYRGLLSRCRLLRDVLIGAIEGQVKACDAFASGVQAAIVINTLAKNPENSDVAISFYRDRQKEKLQRYAARAAAFYKERAAVCDQRFWRERASLAGGPMVPAFAAKMLDGDCRVRLSDNARIEPTPTIQGQTIVSMAGLHHSSLDRPVVYLDEVELVPLLRQLRSGQTVRSIVESWSEDLSVELSWKVIQWLWDRSILVPLSWREARGS